MVVFELTSNEHGIIRYHYYPENHRDQTAGIIELNTLQNTIDVIQKAEDDILRQASVQELNALRDDVNNLRRENGEDDLTEDEWPSATEPEEWYMYADHAMRKIYEAYINGEILEHGTVMWY